MSSSFSNPLEKLLTERAMTKLPKLGGPKMPHLGRIGMHENQPKVKPLAHGFKQHLF